MRKLLLAVVLLSTSGCATLLAPGPDTVSIDSNPRGATIYLDDAAVGLTPASLTVQRKPGVRKLRIEAAGFEPQECKLDRSYNWWSAFNYPYMLIYVGFIGLAIDAEKGNTYKVSQAPVFMALTPTAAPAVAAPSATPTE